MRRLIALTALLALALGLAAPGWADPAQEAAKVVVAYFTTAAAEDIQAHMATRDLSGARRQKAADFAQEVWRRVGTRNVKVGKVEVAVSPNGDQALAQCKVSAEVVNKETGDSFAKQTTYVAVLVKRSGQWKVRRMLPKYLFRRVQNQEMLVQQAQKLVETANRDDAAPPPAQGATLPAKQVNSPRPAQPATSAAPPSRPGPARPIDSIGNIVSSSASTMVAASPAPPSRAAYQSPPAPASPLAAAASPVKVLRMERDMIFINRGAAQGLAPGRRYELVIYREVMHPVTGKMIHLPHRVALILVRQVWTNRARCLVLDAMDKLAPGLSLVSVTAFAE